MQNNDPKKDGLFVPTRQVGMIVSMAILMVFGVFMSGYFLGKKQVTNELLFKIEQESFADQVYSSLCALYDQDPDEGDADEAGADKVASADGVKEEAAAVEVAKVDEGVAHEQAVEVEKVELKAATNQKQYYAQLIGFGTKQAADQFAQRINKFTQVEVKPRSSSSAKGRVVTWYQVVTKPYGSRKDLAQAVDRITKQEKLKNIQISTC